MPEEEHLSEAIQDYLKAIYELSREGQVPSTNSIAERLNVAPASVTGMLKRLAGMTPPLVNYRKHHGVQLTDEGERVSLQVLRKHRLIETFLVGMLGYRWDEVHAEAERLEHAVSFQFSERLARLLGEPVYDPHGDPIPDRDLHVPRQATVALSDVPAGQAVTVRRVLINNPDLLRYLAEMGVQPGSNLSVLAQVPFDRTVHVKLEKDVTERVLGHDVSSLIQVEVDSPVNL